ncbi:MAG TPA: ATP-binding protein [Rhodocyclaceae bacterium]|nr:ATP-binding protein [Rhodocyclaceae bacterium]
MRESPERPDFDDLRRRAEQRLEARLPEGISSDVDVRKLLHELQVYQIELEMQNDALRQARVEAQAVLARYTELYDSAPVGYFSVDRAGLIRQLNFAAARLLDEERPRLLGLSFRQFVEDRDRPIFDAFLTNVFAGQTKEVCEVRLVRADSGQPLCFTHMEAVVGEASQVFNAVVVDITAKVLADEALRSSQQNLEMAVHGADLGIWNWNMRSGELVASPRFRQLFGIPAEEAMSYERFLEALYPGDREAIGDAVRQALKSHEEYNVECRIRWPDGSIHWIAAVGCGFYDEVSGDITGMSGIALDITERKALEEAMQRLNDDLEHRVAERTVALSDANEELVRSNQELHQFAYIAAHDLQTPLRSIAGFAQLLQKDFGGLLGAQGDAWINQIVLNVRRLHELIQDLLVYSRIDTPGTVFDQTDLRLVFDSVVAALDASIRETGAAITCGDLPVVVGSRIQLAQLLQNLIGNGIKYHGAEAPRVHVAAERSDKEWIISVRDNGIGIPEKHRERIFEIFRRLHSQEAYPGTGIGLAVCRRVVQRHGGRIWAESTPGQGSVFKFTLPDQSK